MYIFGNKLKMSEVKNKVTDVNWPVELARRRTGRPDGLWGTRVQTHPW